MYKYKTKTSNIFEAPNLKSALQIIGLTNIEIQRISSLKYEKAYKVYSNEFTLIICGMNSDITEILI